MSGPIPDKPEPPKKWFVADFGIVKPVPQGWRHFRLYLPPSKRRVAG